jgi:uncharacterized protein
MSKSEFAMSLKKSLSGPWYREPWPWLLMSGPAIAVVAGFVTLAFAVVSQDGLVVDDYYRQGKAINQSLHRDVAAQRLDLRAWVTFDQANDRVQIDLASERAAMNDAPLKLTFVHATRSGRDQTVLLQREDGRYVGTLPPLPAGKWHVLLEDSAREWRLQRDVTVGVLPIPRTLLAPAA